MTDLAQAADAIYKDWLAYVASASLSDPFLFGNEDSVGGVKPDEGSAPWFRVSYREAAGGRANLNGSVGSRRYERLGFLAIQCFAPANTGVKTAFQMAEGARDYFEDSRSATAPATVIYLNADVRPQEADGKWFPVLLEVSVEVTDFK